jgi:hypothetical protein
MLLLRQDQLNMTGGIHVGTDATVGTVGSTTVFGRLLNLDMADNEIIHVKALDLGIALSILEQLQKEISRFDGPATLRRVESFGLCTTAYAAVETTKWNTLLLLFHILKVLDGLLQRKTFERGGRFTGILEVDTKKIPPSLTS